MYQTKANPMKKKIVNKLKELIQNYNIVGLADVSSLPAIQFQRLRSQLRGNTEIYVTKKRLLKIALKESESVKPNINKLSEELHGTVALVLTNGNAFKLMFNIQKNKSKAPAKAGQRAPYDIYVEPGPTGFAPGPIIAQLSQIGIKAGIENGKVAIKQRSLVLNQNQEFTDEMASILIRLGIEPMEVGLDLYKVYENGIIFNKETLIIDEDEYKNNIITANNNALGLALEISYICKDTAKILLNKAIRDAFNLSIAKNIINKDNAKQIISKLHNIATNIHQKINA